MKRYVMECVGVFFLALAISLIGNSIAIGLMLMAMIYLGGHISGGHFNPAITFACFVQKRLSLETMGMYVAAQSCGAILALCLVKGLTGNSFSLDVVPGSPVLFVMGLEALFALVLCWIYLTMNFSGRYKDTNIQGIVIGLTLLALGSLGNLLNPAVGVASVLCNMVKTWDLPGIATIAIYIAGPLVGGFGAAMMYNYFKPEHH